MRSENWPEILHRETEGAMFKPFAWGSHDCCLFAFGVVKAITGNDYVQVYRGKYDSQISAYKALAKYGKRTIRETVTSLVGPEMSPLMAQRGDLVLTIMDSRESLGICLGTHCAFVGVERMQFIKIDQIEAAWRV